MTVNGTAVKKLSLARSTLPILGTHLHTKRKAIIYTGLQLNQMEQQIIKDRKRQSYIYQMEQQIIKDRKRQSYVHDLQ